MSKESGMCDYLTFAIFLHLSFFNFFAEYLTLCSENYINTCASNMTGHPALSINAGFSEGLPVGMMIVGRKFEEATLLNLAYALENIRDSKE